MLVGKDDGVSLGPLTCREGKRAMVNCTSWNVPGKLCETDPPDQGKNFIFWDYPQELWVWINCAQLGGICNEASKNSIGIDLE